MPNPPDPTKECKLNDIDLEKYTRKCEAKRELSLRGSGGRKISRKEYKMTVLAVFFSTAGYGTSLVFVLKAIAMLATASDPGGFGSFLLMLGVGILGMIGIFAGSVCWQERKLP